MHGLGSTMSNYLFFAGMGLTLLTGLSSNLVCFVDFNKPLSGTISKTKDLNVFLVIDLSGVLKGPSYLFRYSVSLDYKLVFASERTIILLLTSFDIGASS